MITDRMPILRVNTRPNDANMSGDIFGGWLMSQIDIAGSIIAIAHTKGPVVTVAVKELRFIKPIFVHDIVSFYGEVIAIGTTSITVKLEVFSQRLRNSEIEMEKVSDAILVYVAVTTPGKKRIISK